MYTRGGEDGSGSVRKNEFFFLNETANTEVYPLSLQDALPISSRDMVDPVAHRRTMSTSVIAVSL